MTIAIDIASDSEQPPTTSATFDASKTAAQNTAGQSTAADDTEDSPGCTAELSAQLQTDADDPDPADQPWRNQLGNAESRPPATTSMSDAELDLLEQLKDRKDAAQAVFMALERAEQAATAAAEVSRPPYVSQHEAHVFAKGRALCR